MSKYSYQQTDDVASDDLPRGAPDGQVSDNSYARPGGRNEPIPVVKDEASIEDPINESNADSDQQLQRDDREAIDRSNIMKDRTRGAQPLGGDYREPTDRELGGDFEDEGI